LSVLRKAVMGIVVLAFVVVAAVFAYSNPEPISLDVGIARFESVSMALVFACTFALGWIFGLITAGIAMIRMAGERQKLKRDLRFAEAEISTLRSLPMQDAN